MLSWRNDYASRRGPSTIAHAAPQNPFCAFGAFVHCLRGGASAATGMRGAMGEGRPFDVLWGGSRNKAACPGFEPLAAWLAGTPQVELERRQHAAEAAFRSLGITFSVYGE